MTANPEPKSPTINAENYSENEAQAETPNAIFQAIGIITGDVTFEENKIANVTIAGQTYPLLYKPQLQVAMSALKLEIEKTGVSTQRLVVYPKATHFPQANKPHQLAFQLLAFEKDSESSSISSELDNFEFRLCGLWQFIPVCRVPVISVFRNFEEKRLQKLKEAEPAKKVTFMKPAHLPVSWRDAPIRPFRFNPKVAKEEQGRPMFVQIKAKFIPQKNGFDFVALLAPPQEKAPKFFKASKQDKATAQKQKKQAKLKPKLKTDNPPSNE